MNAPLPPQLQEQLQKSALIDQLRQALGTQLPAHAVLWQQEDTTPYECDGLTAYRQRPLMVALPETDAQIQAVLKACSHLGVPVVARGAGQGLTDALTRGCVVRHDLGTMSLCLGRGHKE